ncbi:hypothetical protein PVAP13_9KG654232 [Panicum virgatum]|uniref:Uncharacterized protein n=1 Tax=Panicum virgatum TaxID=38727 RepID=A0A8T0NXB5_PANVG|nr:hypothetical protein PVAP13_9KG654232 [Panicum virgatum]
MCLDTEIGLITGSWPQFIELDQCVVNHNQRSEPLSRAQGGVA